MKKYRNSQQRYMRQLILLLITTYQRLVSPFLGPNCRFDPSCSQYGYEAIARHGILNGGKATIIRLLKCHPFHPGGIDPVR
ncbi:MAG: membrane protein insertion efficiency factor YidD [Nitrospirales bacterium]|nr:membrane protein insertion efficiency factor YidD [Nitrospirales bacterium]